MKSVALYLLQVIIISGILYSYYHLFLRNKKFHGYNRFYLLATLGISIIIPFLNIPVYFENATENTTFFLQNLTVTPGNFEEEGLIANQTTQTAKYFNWKLYLWILYSITVLLLLIRFITAIAKIFRLKKKYAVEKIDNIDFINTDESNTPFSFFRNLFWNQKIALDSEDGKQVFRHEYFHIEQKHSLDIVFAEIVCILFWMNPFFYLLKKEIKTIHEFLADQFAAKVNEEWNYAELLLMQVLGSPNQRLTNHFFHNQIKRRIAMITTSQKPSYQYLRKLLVLPVAAVITVLFAFKYQTKAVTSHEDGNLEKTITVVIDAGHGESDPGVIAADGTKESDITLQLAQKINEVNKNDRIKIVLTRTTKETVDLKKRTEIANAQNPDLFISLHANAAESNTSNSGFEVFVSKKNTTYFAENKIFGAILLNYFMNIYKTTNKIQQGKTGIWVLDNSNCPSALVECGYITNKQDLEFVKNPLNQSKIAESILNSIEQFVMQKKLPDFEEKKKQVSDTSKPEIKITKTNANKISGTVNGIAVNRIFIDKKTGSAGFVLENDKMIVIPKEDVESVKKKYGSLWNDFNNSFTDTIPVNKTKSAPPNIVFEKTEVEPSFPGGEIAWQKYLQRNLDVNVAVKNKAPEGSYTVWILFIVGKDGYISDIKALTNHGFGMENEVISLIKKGPMWIPALQNGKKVNAYKKQSVTFVVQEENSLKSLPNEETSKINNIKAYLLSPEEGRYIGIQQLKNIHDLKLAYNDDGYEIKNFLITFDNDKSPIKEIANKGSEFNKEILSEINQLKDTTYITIESIWVQKGKIIKRLYPGIYTALN